MLRRSRARAKKLTFDEWTVILSANVTASHITEVKLKGPNGEPRLVKKLWAYPNRDMRGTPVWAELPRVKHLLSDIFDASEGARVNQKSMLKAAVAYFKARHEIDEEQIEAGCYRLRAMMSQLIEHKKRCKDGNLHLPARYVKALQPLYDRVIVSARPSSLAIGSQTVNNTNGADEVSSVIEDSDNESESESSYGLWTGRPAPDGSDVEDKTAVTPAQDDSDVEEIIDLDPAPVPLIDLCESSQRIRLRKKQKVLEDGEAPPNNGAAFGPTYSQWHTGDRSGHGLSHSQNETWM